jgi:tRNA acetyltransferase TAN1
VRKVLASGLESLCDEVLPAHFKVQSDDPNAAIDQPAVQGCKFAIRPTIRNNNKLDRDQVIKVVADKVTALGNGKHTVDLKGYDKLILVDVYRNIVGMSVVGNEFESLKRFNLAEIHALHFDEDKKPEDESVES